MSSDTPDKAAVRNLLVDAIDSFEKLEIVIHVAKTGFAVVDTGALTVLLSLSDDEVDRCVRALRRAGVLDPAGPRRSAVDDLVRMYEDDRIEVLNLMASTALDRVRRDAARAFSDAFILTPKKKRDPDG